MTLSKLSKSLSFKPRIQHDLLKCRLGGSLPQLSILCLSSKWCETRCLVVLIWPVPHADVIRLRSRQCVYSGVNIDRWAVLSFVSRRMQPAVANFATRLAGKCNEMGMVRIRSTSLTFIRVPIQKRTKDDVFTNS